MAELDPRRRRRVIARTVLDLAGAWVLLLSVYYVVPFEQFSSGDGWLRFGGALVVFALVIVWQTRRIVDSDFPALRAIRALGVSIPLFLVVFAGTYLSMSLDSRSYFSQPLGHTSSLYFTVTVFATVGFGDITPRGDAARALVSFQMLLDLVLLGGVVRVVVGAARTGLARSTAADGSPGLPPDDDLGPVPPQA